MTRNLTPRLVKTAGLFQGLVALPVMLVMGNGLFDQLFYFSYYSVCIYRFITNFFNALMAASILFFIILQRQGDLSKKLAFVFETCKSVCATAVWLWLVLDSALGPNKPSYGREPPPRGPRIIRSVISGVTLLFLFYPTLVFAYIDYKKGEDGPNEEEGRVGESTPLLRE